MLTVVLCCEVGTLHQTVQHTTRWMEIFISNQITGKQPNMFSLSLLVASRGHNLSPPMHFSVSVLLHPEPTEFTCNAALMLQLSLLMYFLPLQERCVVPEFPKYGVPDHQDRQSLSTGVFINIVLLKNGWAGSSVDTICNALYFWFWFDVGCKLKHILRRSWLRSNLSVVLKVLTITNELNKTLIITESDRSKGDSG